MPIVYPQENYESDTMNMVMFLREGYNINEGAENPKEDEIIYPKPHLALLLGPYYGILIQSVDGKPLDHKEVERIADGVRLECETSTDADEKMDAFISEMYEE